MTPSQLRVMNEALQQRALVRHARKRLDALWPLAHDSPPTGDAADDVAGWLAIEAIYARSLAVFLGIERKSRKRPLLVPSVTAPDDATLEDIGKPILKIETFDRSRSEILWDGLDAAHREFAHLTRSPSPARPDPSAYLAELRGTIRRFSLLVDELFSREL
jgi:hypothetical protein